MEILYIKITTKTISVRRRLKSLCKTKNNRTYRNFTFRTISEENHKLRTEHFDVENQMCKNELDSEEEEIVTIYKNDWYI